MSFESAKKYGKIGSMIRIITPVITIIAVVALLITFFATFISTIENTVTPTLASSALLLGLFGTILIVGIVDLAGYILFLIAMNRLSQYYNEKSLFRNVLNALIIQTIAATVAFTVLIAWLFSNWTNLITATSTSVPLLTRLGIYALIIPISLAISIYCGLLYKRSFEKLGEKSGVDSFKTAGLLFLIGGIIGSLIIWIAWIFANIGFRKLSLTQQPSQTKYAYSPTQAPVMGMTKHCPTCGAENSLESLYCAHCGRQL